MSKNQREAWLVTALLVRDYGDSRGFRAYAMIVVSETKEAAEQVTVKSAREMPDMDNVQIMEVHASLIPAKQVRLIQREVLTDPSAG